MAKQERIEGSFLKIILPDGDFCYGRVLKEPLVAFYDLKAKKDCLIERVVSLPILFKIWVMNNAITSGRWTVVGHVDLDDDLKKSVPFLKQDPISRKISLYIDSKETPAVYEQCVGLERAAVWSPEHVESRLYDYYMGTPNKWVESLKVK